MDVLASRSESRATSPTECITTFSGLCLIQPEAGFDVVSQFGESSTHPKNSWKGLMQQHKKRPKQTEIKCIHLLV